MGIDQNSDRPHDKFVKSMLCKRPVIIDFFNANLPPKIRNELELETLTIEQGTFIDRRLRGGYTDVLCKVMTKKCGETYLYLLIEHYSGADPLIALKPVNYVMRIVDHHIKEATNAKRDPLPLPCVFVTILYNGKRSYKGERQFFKLFGDYAEIMETQFTKGFNFVDLSVEAKENLRGEGWASLMKWCLRYAMQREFLPYLSEFGLFVKDVVGNSTLTESDINRIEIMLQYMSMSLNTEAESDILLKALRATLPLELENTMATLGQQLIAKGEVRGEARGKIIGEAKGITETLDAITLIQQSEDDETSMRQTNLDLKTIQTLRKKLLH